MCQRSSEDASVWTLFSIACFLNPESSISYEADHLSGSALSGLTTGIEKKYRWLRCRIIELEDLLEDRRWSGQVAECMAL